MKNWLCDTNVISELMRRKPFPRVANWLRQQDNIYLSVVTVEEICYGLHRKNLKKKRTWFEKFLASRCEILEIDSVSAQRAGEIRGRLSAQGNPRSQADMLIAATAWRHDLIVVTRNTADFDGTAVPVYNPFEE